MLLEATRYVQMCKGLGKHTRDVHYSEVSNSENPLLPKKATGKEDAGI